MDKAHYVEACWAANRKFFDDHPKTILKYKRKNKQKVGVVLAFREDDEIRVGFSKCFMRKEPFNREIGLRKAIERAVPLREIDLCKIPNSMLADVCDMVNRAVKYYKVPQSVQ